MEDNNLGVILAKLSNGDVVRRYYKGIIIDFAGNRKVAGTSILNGGCRDDLNSVFNFNCLAEEMSCELHEDTYENELKSNARSLGLNPDKTTGMSTAAWMEMASVVSKKYKELEVTAIVTAGIDTNGTRVGDPASYYEEAGVFHLIKPGTINILLHINCNLPYGSMNRAIMTSAIAKAVACEELFLGSVYSTGLATGSGTDGIIVVCDNESENCLTDAGEHSKLGELIGIAVKEATKGALYKHTGAGPARQHKLLVRGKRYGISTGSLWEYYINHKELFNKYENTDDIMNIRKFEKTLDDYNGSSSIVVFTSLYVHILDQLQWKMIEWAEAVRETKNIAVNFWNTMGIKDATFDFKIDYNNNITDELVDQFKYIIIVMIFKVDIYG